MADYNQGRRYGNGSGQAGAFGANTGFGGFGQQNNSGPFGTSNNTGGGIFGSQPTSTVSPFGGTQTASSAFGTSNTSGGIFNGLNSKPAGSNIFGTTTNPPQSSGNIFGTTGQSAFGASTGTNPGFGGNTATGGSLFGTGTQQQPAKPSFLFNTTGTGSAFGTNNTANTTNGGNLFGVGQTTSLLGGGQQQQQQQQAPASNPFGGFGTSQPQGQTGNNTAFNAFGGTNQQGQKPGGLFNIATTNSGGTGGGAFGGNQNQQPSAASNLFGTNANNQTGSNSLFDPKPASTSGGLFPNNASNAANNTSGLFSSSFGTNNTSNQQGAGIFGGNSQQQQPKPNAFFPAGGAMSSNGLLSNNNNNNNNNNNQQPIGGNSLFGNIASNGQPQGSSLFGNTNNNGSSAFGNQQQAFNALQPPQTHFASVLGDSPYGSSSIFTGLPPPPQMNAGPIATPISTGLKIKKSTILPQYKINPQHVSRLVTPQKRGFGFSYSTYGTPSSIASNGSTPGGLSSSLLYGSIGRGLGKSFSTSNLRRTFDSDVESVLSPGAFSTGSARLSGSGSLKKLTIDRSLRTDLFGSGSQGLSAFASTEKNEQSKQPGILKKRVSFDSSTVGGNESEQQYLGGNTVNGFGSDDDANSATPSAQEQGFLRSTSRGSSRTMKTKSNGALTQTEIEQVKGNELAIVHEDESSESVDVATQRPTTQVPQADPQPGPYWMKPSKAELGKWPKESLKRVSGFSIGREGCGHVEFNEPVDLTLAPLDDIYEKYALIELRSLTIYPDSTMKPSVGKGMNVPSTIFLENSWPRQKDRKTPSHEKSGPKFNKHVDRLRKVTGTEFVRYEKDTGTWVFKVPHFTTYALDYEETGSDGDSLNTTMMSITSDHPTPKPRGSQKVETPAAVDASAQSSSLLSNQSSCVSSSPDDTFEFRRKKILPGAFDNDHEMDDVDNDERSLVDQSLATSSSESDAEELSESQDQGSENGDGTRVVQDDEMEMAGSFPLRDLEESGPNYSEASLEQKSLMKFAQQDPFTFGTPTKLRVNSISDWAEELQRTTSPRKQDRQVLREHQRHILGDRGDHLESTLIVEKRSNGVQKPLATSIDLMNSLFGEVARGSGRSTARGTKATGFQV